MAVSAHRRPQSLQEGAGEVRLWLRGSCLGNPPAWPGLSSRQSRPQGSPLISLSLSSLWAWLVDGPTEQGENPCASGSLRASEHSGGSPHQPHSQQQGQEHPAPTGSALLSSESGPGLSRALGWGGCEPGCGTCAVSQEAQEERGPGHGGGARFCSLRPRLGRFPPRPLLSSSGESCGDANQPGCRACLGALWFQRRTQPPGPLAPPSL